MSEGFWELRCKPSLSREALACKSRRQWLARGAMKRQRGSGAVGAALGAASAREERRAPEETMTGGAPQGRR